MALSALASGGHDLLRYKARKQMSVGPEDDVSPWKEAVETFLPERLAFFFPPSLRRDRLDAGPHLSRPAAAPRLARFAPKCCRLLI